MLNQILELTKDFIVIESIHGNHKAVNNILCYALSHLKDYNIENFANNGIKSILVYNSSKRVDKFKVLLNAHLDVIPGKEYQFKPQIKGNKLYGVGALDMKAGAACMILAFNEVAKKVSKPIALQLVTDEELGGFNGTKYQIEKGVQADFVIAGEATNLNIVNKAKGILWLKISSFGKTAHGAYPWAGDNAVWKMIQFLDELKSLIPNPGKEMWVSTINLSNIETTNSTFNKIPDNCTVWLDIRYIPEDKNNILNKIKKTLPKGFSMEITANEPALYTEEKNVFIKKLQTAVKEVKGKTNILYGANGSSDARHFASVGGKGIEFGPAGGGSGSDNEWVDIKSLEDYYLILKKFLLAV